MSNSRSSFTVDTPTETAALLGRQDVVAWLGQELQDAAQHVILLHGPRGIGKSALLCELQNALDTPNFKPVYYALSERPLSTLLGELTQRILAQTDLSLPVPESDNAFRTAFLPQVQKELGKGRRLVLLLDDMDALPHDHAFWTIVPLLTADSPPALIFTSSQLPHFLPGKLKSVFRDAPVHEIETLSAQVVVATLAQSEPQLRFTTEATADIMTWSGGYPFFLQALVQQLQKSAVGTLNINHEDVAEAVTTLTENSATNFAPIWADLDLAEQLYTAVLAKMSQPQAKLSAAEVTTNIEAQQYRLRPHKLSWSAEHLVQRRILQQDEDGSYQLAVPLFHTWVKHNKPPLLVKENLDQSLDPQADHAFQKGRESLLLGNHQKATSYFRHAIRDNPYHVGAQLALGTALLALGFVEAAVNRLERAYKLDAAETKYPLAEALVTLAESHMQANNRRGALLACEQFQSLGSHNPALQQKMNAIETAVWNQRGDIALQRGFIDKALVAYGKAGNDRRVTQLHGEQAQAVDTSDLEDEARALMEAEAWSEAVAAYEKLLSIAPDASKRANFQKTLSLCLEEVELAQYFDEGLKALENQNWLLARMSFMHIITRRMNYARHNERALTLLDRAAKGHAFTSMLTSPSNVTPPVRTKPPTQPLPPEVEVDEPEPATETAETTAPLAKPAVSFGSKLNIDNVEEISLLDCFGKGAIIKIAYAPNGDLVALATAMGVYFYETETMTEVSFIETQTPVQALAFAPNGETVATGSWQHVVRLWRVADGELLAELDQHEGSVQALAFSRNGRWLASADSIGEVALWQLNDFTMVRAWPAHEDAVTAVAFSPNNANLLSSSLDHTICLWQVESGSQLVALTEHEAAVNHVAFAPDGHRFFSASQDTTAVLWRLDESGWLKLRRQQDVRVNKIYALSPHHHEVNDVAVSPNGKLVATACSDHMVRLWQANNGALVYEFRGHASAVIAVSFSPDGYTLAAATEDSVQFWDVASHNPLHTIEGHIGSLQSIAVSPNGRLLAMAVDNRVLLWSLEDRTLRHILLGHTDLVYRITFSHQGNILASASADKSVRLWNVFTGMVTHTLTGQQGAVTDVCFSPNDQLLATASEAQTIRIWRTSDGRSLQTLTGHQDAVTAVCFDSTGQLLASASSDQSVRIWAIPDGRLLQTLIGHTGIIWQVCFSPDDTLLASAALDRTARVWRVAEGELLHILDNHEGPVWSVQFSPNGQLLATGSSDTQVRLWHARVGTLLGVLSGHTAPVSSIIFTPDDEKVISASADGTVRVNGLLA